LSCSGRERDRQFTAVQHWPPDYPTCRPLVSDEHIAVGGGRLALLGATTWLLSDPVPIAPIEHQYLILTSRLTGVRRRHVAKSLNSTT
jgi:hypothetical protein